MTSKLVNATLIKIVDDSWVLPSNKLNSGNGEGKLLLGSSDTDKKIFLSSPNDIVVRINSSAMLDYLNSIAGEVASPTQSYRDPVKIRENVSKANTYFTNLGSYVDVNLRCLNHLSRPGIYYNIDEPILHTLRSISLKNITEIHIRKQGSAYNLTLVANPVIGNPVKNAKPIFKADKVKSDKMKVVIKKKEELLKSIDDKIKKLEKESASKLKVIDAKIKSLNDAKKNRLARTKIKAKLDKELSNAKLAKLKELEKISRKKESLRKIKDIEQEKYKTLRNIAKKTRLVEESTEAKLKFIDKQIKQIDAKIYGAGGTSKVSSSIQHNSYPKASPARTRSQKEQKKFRDGLIREFNGICVLSRRPLGKEVDAAHIKPLQICNPTERFDLENGILLSSVFHKLFDDGMFTISIEGTLIISEYLKIDPDKMVVFSNIGLNDGSHVQIKLSRERIKYLEYHRNNIFRSID